MKARSNVLEDDESVWWVLYSMQKEMNEELGRWQIKQQLCIQLKTKGLFRIKNRRILAFKKTQFKWG